MNSSQFSISYAEIELAINARDPRAAADAAIDAAQRRRMRQRRELSDAHIRARFSFSIDDDWNAPDLRESPQARAWREGGGAWTAKVGRVSHRGADGREASAQYAVIELSFDGPRPHARPSGCDDEELWKAVALALAESDALDAAAAPASEPAPRASRL